MWIYLLFCSWIKNVHHLGWYKGPARTWTWCSKSVQLLYEHYQVKVIPPYYNTIKPITYQCLKMLLANSYVFTEKNKWNTSFFRSWRSMFKKVLVIFTMDLNEGTLARRYPFRMPLVHPARWSHQELYTYINEWVNWKTYLSIWGSCSTFSQQH